MPSPTESETNGAVTPLGVPLGSGWSVARMISFVPVVATDAPAGVVVDAWEFKAAPASTVFTLATSQIITLAVPLADGVTVIDVIPAATPAAYQMSLKYPEPESVDTDLAPLT